jgi:alcohol dehydrogenase
MRFNLRWRPSRVARLAFAFGVGETSESDAVNAERAIARIAELVETVGLAGNLRDFGIESKDLSSLAQDALDDSVTANNPEQPTHAQVLSILEIVL